MRDIPYIEPSIIVARLCAVYIIPAHRRRRPLEVYTLVRLVIVARTVLLKKSRFAGGQTLPPPSTSVRLGRLETQLSGLHSKSHIDQKYCGFYNSSSVLNKWH